MGGLQYNKNAYGILHESIHEIGHHDNHGVNISEGSILVQVNKKFHKFERVYRDCIKRTRDKTRIHCTPHDAPGTSCIVTKREKMAALNP